MNSVPPGNLPQGSGDLGALDREVMFHREGTFYIITAYRNDDWAEHVRLNPGTLKVTDAITGEVLWILQ